MTISVVSILRKSQSKVSRMRTNKWQRAVLRPGSNSRAGSAQHDLPSRLGDDHLGAQLVELLPQLLGLQVAGDAPQVLTVAAPLQPRSLRVSTVGGGGGAFGASGVVGVVLGGV